MIHRRDWVLPEQLLFWNERTEIAVDRSHIAVRQLEPGASERVGELIRVLVEAPRDLFVGGIEAQGKIRGEHRWSMMLRRIMRVGHGARTSTIFRCPLMRAGRTLGQFPVELEEIVEEVVAPLGRRLRPDDFKAAADRVTTVTFAEFVVPAETLKLDVGAFGFSADVICGNSRAVRFAKGVTTGNERDGFFVVHRHATEGFADVARCGDGIRLPVGTFGIYIDQTHLYGAERILQIAVAGVTLVGEPGAFRAPVEFFRLPDIRTASAKAKRFETHRIEGDVAGENHQVRPGNFLPI